MQHYGFLKLPIQGVPKRAARDRGLAQVETLRNRAQEWRVDHQLRLVLAPHGLDQAAWLHSQNWRDNFANFSADELSHCTLLAFTLAQLFPIMDTLKAFLSWAQGRDIHIGLIDDNIAPVPTDALLTSLSAVEFYHHKSLGVRASKGRETARANGKFIGKAPWGYDRTGVLKSEAHGEAIKLIIKRAVETHKAAKDRPSLRELAANVLKEYGLTISHPAVATVIKEHLRRKAEKPPEPVSTVVPISPFAGLHHDEPTVDPAVARREEIERKIREATEAAIKPKP